MAKAKTKAPAGPNNVLKVYAGKDEDTATATARAILQPYFRHAISAAQVNKAQFGDMENAPGLGDYADVIRTMSDKAANGDLKFVSRMLAAQAVTLDNVFTELTRRMALNMGEHLNATDIYARHAMKAQAQSRATLEALAKLHQPREQTVRHVHVNEGGQAVIADEFHHHAGGQQNGQSPEQSHEQRTRGPAMLGADPSGNGVPIPGGVREETLQDARRD